MNPGQRLCCPYCRALATHQILKDRIEICRHCGNRFLLPSPIVPPRSPTTVRVQPPTSGIDAQSWKLFPSIQQRQVRCEEWTEAIVTAAVVRHTPPWLASALVHIVLLIVLALCAIVVEQNESIALTAGWMNESGEHLVNDFFEVTIVEPENKLIEEMLTEFKAVAPSELTLASEFTVPDVFAGGSPGLGQELGFAEMVNYSQKYGLDVVITFDSTGSMGAEIDIVKSKIRTIADALLRKVPGCRIGLVSYKDVTDGGDYL